MAQKAKEALGVDEIDVVADRYFSAEQILEGQTDVTVTLPKP